MKKLFVGCLVVVLLLVGGAAWLYFQVAPSVQEAFERMSAANAEFERLEHEHPFVEPQTLDEARFGAFLDARVALLVDVQGLSDHMREDRGFLEALKTTTLDMAAIYEAVPRHLAAAAMGPSEFGWSSRLLYTALDVPSDGPEARAFAEKSGEFKAVYKDLASNDAGRRPPEGDPMGAPDHLPADVRDFLGTFDPTLVGAARAVMAADAARTLEGLGDPSFEIILLNLQRHMKAMAAAHEREPVPDAPADG